MRFGGAAAGVRGSARLAGRFHLGFEGGDRGDFEREVFIEKFKPGSFSIALRVFEVWDPRGARVGL